MLFTCLVVLSPNISYNCCESIIYTMKTHILPNIIFLAVTAILVVAVSILLFSQPVKADHCPGEEVPLSISVDQKDHVCQQDGGVETNPIITYLKGVINFLAVGVGFVVTGNIIVAGIQYTAAQGNPQTTSDAKNRIFKSVVGLLMFIFMYAFLQFLVPGGVLP